MLLEVGDAAFDDLSTRFQQGLGFRSFHFGAMGDDVVFVFAPPNVATVVVLSAGRSESAGGTNATIRLETFQQFLMAIGPSAFLRTEPLEALARRSLNPG